eukprot:8281352-Pyramimonas_sp.AAC.1
MRRRRYPKSRAPSLSVGASPPAAGPLSIIMGYIRAILGCLGTVLMTLGNVMLGRLAMSKTNRDPKIIVERFVVFLEHCPPAVHWKRSGNGWGLIVSGTIWGHCSFSDQEKKCRLWAASA